MLLWLPSPRFLTKKIWKTVRNNELAKLTNCGESDLRRSRSLAFARAVDLLRSGGSARGRRVYRRVHKGANGGWRANVRVHGCGFPAIRYGHQIAPRTVHR